MGGQSLISNFSFNTRVKKRDLIRKINTEAKKHGLPRVELLGDGKHDKLILLKVRSPIARQREIPTGTALSIMKEFEKLFGKDWWRNGNN